MAMIEMHLMIVVDDVIHAGPIPWVRSRYFWGVPCSRTRDGYLVSRSFLACPCSIVSFFLLGITNVNNEVDDDDDGDGDDDDDYNDDGAHD